MIGRKAVAVIVILLITVLTVAIAGYNLQLDMKDKVDSGIYSFRFAEDLQEAYGDSFNLDGGETAFVPKEATEEWKPSWGKRRVYIEDQRLLFEMYDSCWHEIRHWELGQAKDMSTEEDHELIENTPFYFKHRWVCDKLFLTGVKDLTLS